MISTYTSLDTLFSKMVRELDMETVPHQDLVEYTRTVLQTIGAGIDSGQWDLQEITLPVVNHLAKLPGDFYLVNEAHFFLPYRVVNNSLLLDQLEGEVTVPYLAFLKDEYGNLLYPDLPSYQDALRWYFLSMKALQGKAVSQEFSFTACNQYFINKCGEARGDGNMPSIHSIQKLSNDRNNLRYDTNPLSHGFRNQGKVYQRRTFRGR